MTDTNKMFNYIIYHEGCIDGFAGFFFANMADRLTTDVIIHGAQPSATRVPNNIADCDIIIIDVAYNKEILEAIFKVAKSVVYIDHHISGKNDVQSLYEIYNKNKNIKIIFDDKWCAATLAWSYFFGDKKMPLFLKYINDHDTGRWENPKTKPFVMALRIYYKTDTKKNNIMEWHTLLDRKRVSKLVKIGTYMKTYNDYIISVNVEKHTLKKFPSQKVYDMNPDIFNKLGQYTVAVFLGHNCPSISELGDEVTKRFPHVDFCIFWVYDLNRKIYILSLRSNRVNLSVICKMFGGGGHKGAGAFTFASNKMALDDLFYNKYIKHE
jgi:nanoRNase/pAp phosphatase (c-di-AMP/oligoRNAs hydrolase)